MMMVHRDAGHGTFVLDRQCGKLGRLKRASGTTDREEFAALNAMISRLKRERRWDLLALLVQHQVAPLELLDAMHAGTLGALPSADELRPLSRAIPEWLQSADLAPRTRADYETWLAGTAGLTVHGLPAFLRAARQAAIASGKRQTFNNLLTAARSFVAAYASAESNLWRALPTPLDVTRRRGNPQEPADIRALAAHFPYPDELWALCLTAMRRGEYWGSWEILSDRVRVQGLKGPRGEPLPRVVPLVYRPARPRVAYSTFYKALVRESDGALNVHDLRKTAQRWWEDAGVIDWRIKLYAGHSAGREYLATIYRQPRDLTRLLVEDAERVRTWLGDPPQLGLRAVSA